MTSPLELRLMTAIRAETDPTQRAVYTADLACYFARVGDFEVAEKLRTELRNEFGDGRSLQVSVLIMTLEALLLYFKELSPGARDRLLRAKLLCSAAKENRLLGLVSAWLAHIDFNLELYDEMSESIATAINSLELDDGTTECRASLVIADALMFCGESTAARAWYERARVAANKIGDQAAVGALTYNRAALRVAGIRIANVRSPQIEADFAFARSEMKSAINYQTVAGLKSLDHLLQSTRVGILMLEKNSTEALRTIETIIDSGDVPKHLGSYYTLRADRLVCLIQAGQLPAAKEQALQLHSESLVRLSSDDRAICLSALEELAHALGNDAEMEKFSCEKQLALQEHFTSTKRLREVLSPYMRMKGLQKST